MKIRKPFSTVRVSISTGEGLAKQSFKDECDINNIMAKYQRSGLVEHGVKYAGEYMDVSPLDFHEAMNLVIESQAMFDDLPSSVRKRFANDPGTFLEFVQDPENLEECVELGLLPAVPSPPIGEPPAGTGDAEPAPAESPASA